MTPQKNDRAEKAATFQQCIVSVMHHFLHREKKGESAEGEERGQPLGEPHWCRISMTFHKAGYQVELFTDLTFFEKCLQEEKDSRVIQLANWFLRIPFQ